MTPDTCPQCGADLKRGAKACPECGSCEKTGWSDETAADGLPDGGFDYDDFVKREFGGGSEVRPRGVSPLWWVVALVLVLLFFLGYVF